MVPSAEIIKSHYDTILTTMRTSVSYIGNESETFYFEKCLKSLLKSPLLEHAIDGKEISKEIINAPDISLLQVVLHYSTLQQTELTSALDNATAACANVTLRNCNVTREDMDGVITAVLDKVSEECKDGGCLFTEPLKTMVTESFGK